MLDRNIIPSASLPDLTLPLAKTAQLGHEKEQFVDNARRVYDEGLKDHLEKEHFGKIIGLEPESGEYVLGQSFLDVGQASRASFGERPVYFFRVDGGWSSEDWGARTRARLSE